MRKECKKLVRSVKAKKFANLKSLKDFMSRQQHQSWQSNYLNCKKACGVFVCSFATLESCTCEKCKKIQRALQAQWPDILPLRHSWCCKQAMIYGPPCSQSAISDCLEFFFLSPYTLTIVQCWPTTRRLCCTKTWVKLQGKQPHQLTATVNQHPPWRMNGMWWGNSFLLGSSSLANHGG